MKELKVFRTCGELRAWRLEKYKSRGAQKVGFVPTMGALHDGHLKLILHAISEVGPEGSVVVSIFVNPTQFAPDEDFDVYPRTLDRDLEVLNSLDLQNMHELVVFAPSVKEMYPSLESISQVLEKGTFVNVVGLTEMLEGNVRPGFFRGVATVVSKLLVLVHPDIAVFGQKDVQQCFVVKRMALDMLFEPGVIKVVETYRDPVDGLALSSRNVYLTKEQRTHAPAMYRGLLLAKNLFLEKGVVASAQLIDCVLQELEKEGKEHFSVDYIKVSSSSDLSDVERIGPEGAIMSCAWRMGTTRLIDNILLGFSF
ncbi:Pantothenate synthetase [Smittium mucronatum]|uniref:Pantoate--beta-alanine ligase n=1 Tax=Smittium mucronatum TaxID=133383 RepID=A0A1R0H008_9FUNG|nr:Pantothenate synthetase [Smittium mucronatum]